MIEITYADVLQERFPEAFDGLLELELEGDTALSLVESIQVIRDARNKADVSIKTLIKEFGVEVKDGDKLLRWSVEKATEDKQKEFVSKRDEVLATKVELPLEDKLVVHKIKPLHLALLSKLVSTK